MTAQWIKFGIVATLFASGIFVLFVSVFGTFRFKFALNRIHASAMNDTLVLLLFLLGATVSTGFDIIALKFLLIICIQWLASPLVSHMLVKFEYLTDEKLSDYCELPDNKKDE